MDCALSRLPQPERRGDRKQEIGSWQKMKAPKRHPRRSTITLLEAIEALYPLLVLIHVFLDNARYHHAKLVQEWLARPSCRIKLHFIPSYCPHLNPIERLWGVMHRNVTHNTSYATRAQFADPTLGATGGAVWVREFTDPADPVKHAATTCLGRSRACWAPRRRLRRGSDISSSPSLPL
jgi:hypothetical protein